MIKIIQPSDFSTVDAIVRFQSEVEEILESEAEIVLIDLKHITSANSTGFIALIKGLKSVLASGSQLFICSMNAPVRMLFEMTGLDQVFKVFADRDAFHQYLQPASKVEVLRQPKVSINTLKVAV